VATVGAAIETVATTSHAERAPIVERQLDSGADVGNLGTSLQLTPTGWPAISYYDYTNGYLKYTYKDASGWHNQVVDSGYVGGYSSLQLTPTGWPAISYFDWIGDLKYAYKSAS